MRGFLACFPVLIAQRFVVVPCPLESIGIRVNGPPYRKVISKSYSKSAQLRLYIRSVSASDTVN